MDFLDEAITTAEKRRASIAAQQAWIAQQANEKQAARAAFAEQVGRSHLEGWFVRMGLDPQEARSVIATDIVHEGENVDKDGHGGGVSMTFRWRSQGLAFRDTFTMYFKKLNYPAGWTEDAQVVFSDYFPVTVTIKEGTPAARNLPASEKWQVGEALLKARAETTD